MNVFRRLPLSLGRSTTVDIMPSPNPRFHAVARHIVKLPRELVHRIIDDLTLGNLLELVILHDLPYIEECVLGHNGLDIVFQRIDWGILKAYYQIFLTLRWRRRQFGRRKPVVALPYFDDCDITTFVTKASQKDLIRIVTESIEGMVRRYREFAFHLNVEGMPDLWQKLIQDQDDNNGFRCESPEATRAVVDGLWDAERELNRVKAGQLERMASLVERYPSTLRTRGDWFQDPRRNEQHIVDNLRRVGRRMMVTANVLCGSIVGKEIFTERDLFIVPYNRFLQAFLKVIGRYPPTESPSLYPGEMDTVMQGISIIHPRLIDRITSSKVMHRTEYTKFSAPGSKRASGFNQPRFYSTVLQKEFRPSFQENPGLAIAPASDEELDWLEAFLRVCDHISGMTVEMKEGQTVGEYWISHTGWRCTSV